MKITEEFHLVRLGVKAPFKAVESILQKLGMGAILIRGVVLWGVGCL